MSNMSKMKFIHNQSEIQSTSNQNIKQIKSKELRKSHGKKESLQVRNSLNSKTMYLTKYANFNSKSTISSKYKFNYLPRTNCHSKIHSPANNSRVSSSKNVKHIKIPIGVQSDEKDYNYNLVKYIKDFQQEDSDYISNKSDKKKIVNLSNFANLSNEKNNRINIRIGNLNFQKK